MTTHAMIEDTPHGAAQLHHVEVRHVDELALGVHGARDHRICDLLAFLRLGPLQDELDARESG